MRHDFLYSTSDPKSDEFAGSIYVGILCIVGVLAAVGYVFNTISGWFNMMLKWSYETVSYIAGFWPF